MPFPPSHRGIPFARIAALAILAWPALSGAAWTPIPGFRPTPDPSWGPGYSRQWERMVFDCEGFAYVSMGDTLLIVAPDGSSRKAALLPGAVRTGSNVVPVATGGGLIIWGPQNSSDHGSTWTDLGFGGMFPSAIGIFGDGRAIAGGYSDAVAMSVDSGKTWKPARSGRTYGRVSDVAAMSGGWALAAAETDSLLVSTDRGATWKGVRGDPFVRATLLAEDPRGGCAWALYASRYPKVQPLIHRLRREGDSLSVSTRPMPGFPDSAATAWAVSPAGDTGQRLWLGTWGQGIFTSDDGGATWTGRNGGLGDPHVEALAIAPDGRAWALTRDGLSVESPVGTVSLSRNEQAGNSRLFPGKESLPRFRRGSQYAAAGPLFRADGRRVAPAFSWR